MQCKYPAEGAMDEWVSRITLGASFRWASAKRRNSIANALGLRLG